MVFGDSRHMFQQFSLRLPTHMLLIAKLRVNMTAWDLDLNNPPTDILWKLPFCIPHTRFYCWHYYVTFLKLRLPRLVCRAPTVCKGGAVNLSGFAVFSQPQSIHSGSDHWDGNLTRKTCTEMCVAVCLQGTKSGKGTQLSDLVPAIFPWQWPDLLSFLQGFGDFLPSPKLRIPNSYLLEK